MALGPPEIAALVRQEIVETLRADGKSPVSFDDRTRLDGELGLSSLQVVELVSRIGARRRTSSLQRPGLLTDVRTVGDLCAALRDASEAAGEVSDDLMAARQRAQARRVQRQRG